MSYNARVGGFLSAKGPGQKNGTPDIVCVTKPNGHYVGIEVKSDVGRLSATQSDFKRAVEGVGGTFILARSVDDVAPLFSEPNPPADTRTPGQAS